MNTTEQGRTGNGGRRIAYFALLGTTALGTLSANVINAPLYVIQTDLGMTRQQAVLAVSAFTMAMAMFVPLAGWVGDRVGTKTLLVWALSVLVLAGAAASQASGTEALVAARAVQGAACSAIPPCVQAALMNHWPERTAQAMGAWASAIGLGQAVGPLFGGLVTEALGWRNVFLSHGLLVLVMILLLIASMPASGPQRPPMHRFAMFWLVVGAGSTAAGTVLIGQATSWWWILCSLGSAVFSLWLFGRLSVRRARFAAEHAGAPGPLLDPSLLRDRGYLRAAAGAGLAMGSMAVFIVAVPLFLARDLDMGPAGIGAIVFTMALSMIVAGPLAARLGRRRGVNVQLRRGILILMASGPVVALAVCCSRFGMVPWAVLSMVVAGLVLAGTGIAFTQSAAATDIVLSAAGRSGTAVGIHNMIRFLAMGAGYAVVALAYAADATLLLFPFVSLMGVAMLYAFGDARGLTRRTAGVPRPIRVIPEPANERTKNDH
ncbi:MFS transporter [Pseudarthrobacter sp. NPDC092419]|uniref:MFS transporter n=1 Tax=Pseudarthrobacter sp. NPDC092419 TaxID=3364414 RepID=UPI00380388F2